MRGWILGSIATVLFGVALITPSNGLRNLQFLAPGGTSRTAYSKLSDVVSVKDFGAAGDWDSTAHTGTNDTAAVAAARAYAYTNGRILYFPAGTYGIDNTALEYGTTVSSNTKITILGEGEDTTKLAAVSTAQTLLHLKTASDWSNGIEIGRIGFVGYSSADVSTAYGIHMESSTTAGPSHLTIHHVRVNGFSGHGIYLPNQWHTDISDTSVNDCGGNLFDINGGNTTVLTRTYAQSVAPGRAGYRIHGGRVVMISPNGINNTFGNGNIIGGDQADWGVFGNELLTAWASGTVYTVGQLRSNGGEEYEVITAGTSAGSGGPTTISKDITDNTVHWRHIGAADTTNGYFMGTLIGANIEDPTRTGIRLKSNSSLTIQSGTIVQPPGASAGAAGLIGIWISFVDAQQAPLFLDGLTFANNAYDKFEHGSAIHVTTGTGAVVRLGGTTNAPGVWSRVSGVPITSPTITALNNGATGASIYNAIGVSRLVVSGGFTLTRVTPTYGANVTIDPNLGSDFDITATNGVGFTIKNPGANGSANVGIAAGMPITECIINTSGGALGAATFDTRYKMGAAWTQPATGFRRCIGFKSDGSNWFETWRSPADVTN